MRNWNKPVWFNSLYGESFQTTYEELKLITHYTIIMLTMPQSFQTTYEELKLARFSVFHTGVNRASRLPMRNWNLLVPGCLLSIPGFALPDYLWGIETNKEKQWCVWVRTLPDYLWGIETYHTMVRITYNGASRLPMRNWNICFL